MNNKSTEMTKQNLINLAIKEYLETPEEDRSLTKIGEKYGVRRQTISKYLKDMGIEVVNYQNRARLDETVFDSMDTEEQFYWLGFLYADGNISKTGNRLELTLALKDIDHLEKFRKFLKLTTEIKTILRNEHYACRLYVRNKHLWETLNNLGCVPCKSLILEFPKKEIFKNNKMFILHFIRGYVDGDGCLCYYWNKQHTSVNTQVSIVSTESFLNSIKKLFGNKHGYIRNKSSKDWENKAYQLTFNGVIARKFARYLYEKATIYMQRKYEKYLYFCRLEEESSLRKSSKIGKGWDANTEVNSGITKGPESLQSVESE